MVVRHTNSHEATEALGRALGSVIRPDTVIAMFGGLGAGKTAFTVGLADGMGLDVNEVCSPTFAIVHEHRGTIPLYHFDMYRVETPEDLFSTGFYDYLDTGSVLCIEWSENIEEELPCDAVRITIERGETEDERILTMDAGGKSEYEDSWN